MAKLMSAKSHAKYILLYLHSSFFFFATCGVRCGLDSHVRQEGNRGRENRGDGASSAAATTHRSFAVGAGRAPQVVRGGAGLAATHRAVAA